MITYHLIDTENIPNTWPKLINLTVDDYILLFRLKDSNKNYISFDDVVNLINSRINIKIIECIHGKPKMNALDFQLISYLGYLIGYNRDNSFKIYSNDTGFEPAIEYWKNQGIDIEIIKE